MDVIEQEPPVPSDHPLFSAPNTIVTPHAAFATKEAMVKRAVISLENVILFKGYATECDVRKGHIMRKQIRRHIYFSGRVQEDLHCLPLGSGLTGWVKNLWDGRVEMEVQGTEDEIRRLIQGLQEGPYIRIEGMEAENLPLKEKEREFRETW